MRLLAPGTKSPGRDDRTGKWVRSVGQTRALVTCGQDSQESVGRQV